MSDLLLVSPVGAQSLHVVMSDLRACVAVAVAKVKTAHTEQDLSKEGDCNRPNNRFSSMHKSKLQTLTAG
jgi:hypothetical protein